MTEAFIESIDQDGIGVAHVEGKVTFIEGALTGERVAFTRRRSRGNFDLGTATQVLRESAQRVAPRCPYFGLCGGCAMQHVEATAQVAAKQRVLEDNLARLGKVAPERLLPPVIGPSWGYRTRARLAVHYVAKKGSVLVGDVHPDGLRTAGALSPVPGGVGPMTITMLMSNTVKAARLRRGKSSLVAGN